MRKIGLFIIIGLTSCTSISIPVSSHNSFKSIDDKGFANEYLIGDNEELINSIFDFRFKSKDSLWTKKIIVRMDGKRVELKVNHNDQEISQSFKYIKVDKEIRCKKKSDIGLLPPILWAVRDVSNTICIDLSDNLIIYHHRGGILLLGIMPVVGTTNGQMDGVFKLVRN